MAQSVVRTVLLNWGEVGSGWNVVVFVIVSTNRFYSFTGQTDRGPVPGFGINENENDHNFIFYHL